MGILLVILGHCAHIESKLFHIIFTFHMPLFFLLSGYVFRSDIGFGTLFSRRFRSLIVPFALFYLLGLVVTLMIPGWREALTPLAIFQDLYLADPNAVHNSSIWFLECLFVVQLLFWVILPLPAPAQVASCLGLYALGILYSRVRFPLLGFNRLPLNLDVVPVAILFFALGYWLRTEKLVEKYMDTPGRCMTSVIIGTAGLLLCYRFNGYVNLHGLQYGNPILYVVGSLAGTMMMIGISRILENLPDCWGFLKRILLFYGKNSLIILGVQSLAIRLTILVFNSRGHEFQLYRLPGKYALASMVIVAFGICPAVCFFLTLLNKRTEGNGSSLPA